MQILNNGDDYEKENNTRHIIHFGVHCNISVSLLWYDSVIKYTTSYAENGVPTKDGEANFNRDTGTPYAILEDGMVVVMIDNEWIEFKAK